MRGKIETATLFSTPFLLAQHVFSVVDLELGLVYSTRVIG